jgi:AraC-like DNA-binding protein
MGVLALLMRNAPSVGVALAELRRWFHLHDRGAVPTLRDLGDDGIALGYALVRHDTPGAGLVVDTALAIAWRMLRALCGPQWRPTLVAFAHAPPQRAAAFGKFFEAPLQFDATHSELQFDARWLAAPIAGADAARLAEVQRAAERLDHGRERSLGERARTTAQALVLCGAVSAPRIVAALAIHERTLRRHLRAEGTSLKAIIAGTRFETACQLLRETRLPLRDIAAALNYADATALSRAFKAISGVTPSRWRQRPAPQPQPTSSRSPRTRRST